MTYRKSKTLLLPSGMLLCAALSVLAQQASQKASNLITEDELRHHLNIIANDETQGRDTPSPGVNIVSRYLATMAQHYGFKPVMPDSSYFQNIPLEVPAVSASKSRLRVISSSVEATFYCPESFFGRTAGYWWGDIVFVGYGLGAPDQGWDDYGKLDLAGKVVVMLDGQLPEGHALRSAMSTRTSVPRSRGASLILRVISPERNQDMVARSVGFQVVLRPTMLATYPSQNQARISAAAQPPQPKQPPAQIPPQAGARLGPAPGEAEIRHEAAANILGLREGELAAMFADIAGGKQVPGKVLNKRAELSIVLEKRLDSSPNVLAVLEGSDPVLKSEYVVLTSHHDHNGMRNGKAMNGADDDGSGVVGMIAIAKALAVERPKRSVILAWLTGEEKMLWGSHYFVNNCPIPLEKISANLNLDMISRNDPGSIYLIASDNLSSELDASIRAMNEKSAKLKFDYQYNNRTHRERFYYRSDHYPFLRMGIPAVWIFCGTTPDYHTVNDTIERVDFRKMEKVTRLAYLVTLDIGNKPALLKLDANAEVTSRGKHNTAVESIR